MHLGRALPAGRPAEPGEHAGRVAEQGPHVPFLARCRLGQLVRPDAGHDWDAAVVDALEKVAQLPGIKNRLSDRVFGAGLNLPFKAPHLLFHIHCAGINADADRKCGRFADRIVANVQTVI